MDRILVVTAHPDDEVLGMGGTIAKLVAEGNEVFLAIVTDGSSAQYRASDALNEIIEKKRLATEKSAHILGIKQIIYCGLPDMRLDTVPHIEVNAAIESVVNDIKPDVVYTHFYGDVNMDHRCVYESTLVAVRPVPGQSVREVYCYSVPSSTEWSPLSASTAFLANVYMDIEQYAQSKYAALAEYCTELRDYPHPRSLEAIEKLDEAIGLTVGLKRAESFVLLRRVV